MSSGEESKEDATEEKDETASKPKTGSAKAGAEAMEINTSATKATPAAKKGIGNKIALAGSDVEAKPKQAAPTKRKPTGTAKAAKAPPAAKTTPSSSSCERATRIHPVPILPPPLHSDDSE